MQGYKIFEYLDLYTDEKGEWYYKSICEMKMHVLLPPKATDREIIEAIRNAGYLLEYIAFARKGDDIALMYKEDGAPIGIMKRVA